MNVSLTPELEAFVHDKVASGRYTSASEVIRESLRLLEDEDRTKKRNLEALRLDLQRGLDDLAAGRLTPLETEDDYATLSAQIKSEGTKLSKRRKNNGQS